MQRPASQGKTERRIWEVIAPSIISFPREARQVTMKVLPNSRLGYPEILSFEPHLATREDYVERAKRGAERDTCNQTPRACVDGHPKQSPVNIVYPRLWFALPE